METVLNVESISKAYPDFRLDNVGFKVEKGSIMGFIGRNGAGKTTTLKSILNLVHPDSGKAEFFGINLTGNETELKQRIGYASGSISYYNRKKIKDIVKITKEFYKDWDDSTYRHYLKLFNISEDKKPIELSEGMKVKLNLAISLSHKAELLILDEPTSGLDPVSRDELNDIFLSLAEKGVTILFSTHIISDLEKCADFITYIKNGKIVASDNTENFITKYRIIHLDRELTDEQRAAILSVCKNKCGNTALIKSSDIDAFEDFTVENSNLEKIIIHLEKENCYEINY